MNDTDTARALLDELAKTLAQAKRRRREPGHLPGDIAPNVLAAWCGDERDNAERLSVYLRSAFRDCGSTWTALRDDAEHRERIALRAGVLARDAQGSADVGRSAAAELYQAQRTAVRDAAHAEGRTFYSGRCNCYRGGGAHSPNSGRCRVTDVRTLPERHGICDGCWTGCGHASPTVPPSVIQAVDALTSYVLAHGTIRTDVQKLAGLLRSKLNLPGFTGWTGSTGKEDA